MMVKEIREALGLSEREGLVTLTGETYRARFTDDTWNGFVSRPRFTREEAERVAAIEFPSDEYNETDSWWEGSTLFIRESLALTPEAIEPDSDGLYSIGADAYCWQEVGEHVHQWGEVQRSRFAGTLHRACSCGQVTLDLSDDEGEE